MGNHTVEKIGGTSMSKFDKVLENIIIGNRTDKDFYNRIFVVSAYGGITNLLLGDKKTGAPGVYARFAEGDEEWQDSLEIVREKMIEYNRSFKDVGLDQNDADNFVNERIAGIKTCLNDLMRVVSFGHIRHEDLLPASREFLSAVGEAHSAYNSTQIIRSRGVNAIFVDLTGWRDTRTYALDEMIQVSFRNIDFSNQLPIVTGYVKCEEGIMNRFDRGYSEITFSKIAVNTDAKEGIIHKEYHLCTGDPVLIGKDKVKIMGNTNFDMADQMSDMDMEAIHSKASKEMELKNIPIRVKNTFEPDHPGTLITKDYVSKSPKVEMICGRDDLIAIQVFDSEMVGQSGYDYRLLENFAKYGISYIAKNTNANTINHYIPEKAKNIRECIQSIRESLRNSDVDITNVAVVSVIGSNMKIPGFLSRAAKALAEAKINVLALDQCMRQVNMQFIIKRSCFNDAQVALHREFVENEL